MKYLEISVRGIIIPEPDNREWCVMAHFILPFVESHLPWLTPSSTGSRRCPRSSLRSPNLKLSWLNLGHRLAALRVDLTALDTDAEVYVRTPLALEAPIYRNARYWRFAPHFPSARELASLEAIGLWVDAANATSICRRGSTSSRGAIGSNPSCRRIRRPARSGAQYTAKPDGYNALPCIFALPPSKHCELSRRLSVSAA